MNIDMIEAAAERLKGRARVTPMLNSPFLDELAGRRVFVKPECLQHTGSFKFRGAWSAISNLPDDTRGVIAFSSGNHAQGVAYAAKLRGLPAVIVMPTDAPAIKRANTEAYGAEVVTYDKETEVREEIGARLAEERGLALIKPFDTPEVLAGQGTCGLEIAAQAAELGVDPTAEVLVCTGGGGLCSGIALALEARAPEMRVRPVEPEGFDDVTRSLQTHSIQKNNQVSGSIADAILTIAPGVLPFPIMDRLCGPGIVVSDDDCLYAMAHAFQRLKVVAEPGGAIALAAALKHGDQLRDPEKDVIVTISGGNVDRPMFERALAAHG